MVRCRAKFEVRLWKRSFLSTMSNLLSIRVHYGSTPDTWDLKLPRYALFIFALTPLYFLASLTQLPNFNTPFDFSKAPATATITYLGLFLLVVPSLAGAILLWSRRALGLVVQLSSWLYFGSMLSALMIAAIPIGSGTLVVVTIIFDALSIYGLIKVNGQIDTAQIIEIRNERIAYENGVYFLRPATMFENGGLVQEIIANTKCPLPKWFEFGGAVIVLFLGSILLPISIAGDFAKHGFIAPLIWFCCVMQFLAVRRIVNIYIVLLRAMWSER